MYKIVNDFKDFVDNIKADGPQLSGFISNGNIYYCDSSNELNILSKIENNIKYVKIK